MKIDTDEETLKKLDSINILKLLEAASIGNLVRGINWTLAAAGELLQKASTLADVEPRPSKKGEKK